MIEKKNSFEVKYLLFSSDIENFQEAFFFFFDNLFKKLHSSRVSKKSSRGPVMVESSYELHPACSMRTRKLMLTSKSCWWGGIEYVRVVGPWGHWIRTCREGKWCGGKVFFFFFIIMNGKSCHFYIWLICIY